jgi:hypothetical protein
MVSRIERTSGGMPGRIEGAPAFAPPAKRRTAAETARLRKYAGLDFMVWLQVEGSKAGAPG